MHFVDLKSLSANKGIPVSTIRKYIKKGLPHYRPNKKIYICPEEFDEWFRDTCRPSLSVDIKKTINNIVKAL